MASHGGMLLSVYDNIKSFKLNNVIYYNKIDGMKNAIAFLRTLLGLELAEIRGFKVGALITSSLSNLLYRVSWNQSNRFIYVQNNAC